MIRKDKNKFILESHSPYSPHVSEGLRVLIIAVVFDGKNYELWERVVLTTLKAENKLGFIDRTLKWPKKAKDQKFS